MSAASLGANEARLAPLLAALKRDGIGHCIAGKRSACADGRAFETRLPVDTSVIADVARRTHAGPRSQF